MDDLGANDSDLGDNIHYETGDGDGEKRKKRKESPHARRVRIRSSFYNHSPFFVV